MVFYQLFLWSFSSSQTICLPECKHLTFQENSGNISDWPWFPREIRRAGPTSGTWCWTCWSAGGWIACYETKHQRWRRPGKMWGISEWYQVYSYDEWDYNGLRMVNTWIFNVIYHPVIKHDTGKSTIFMEGFAFKTSIYDIQLSCLMTWRFRAGKSNLMVDF